MPDIQVFALCTLASIDLATSRLSLIQLLEAVEPVARLDPKTAQEGAGDIRYILPHLWVATALVNHSDELGVEFEQRITITAPDGQVAELNPSIRFKATRPFHNIVTQYAVAARLPGKYALTMYLRHFGEEEWGEPRGRYQFLLQDPALEPATIPGQEALGV